MWRGIVPPPSDHADRVGQACRLRFQAVAKLPSGCHKLTAVRVTVRHFEVSVVVYRFVRSSCQCA